MYKQYVTLYSMLVIKVHNTWTEKECFIRNGSWMLYMENRRLQTLNKDQSMEDVIAYKKMSHICQSNYTFHKSKQIKSRDITEYASSQERRIKRIFKN